MKKVFVLLLPLLLMATGAWAADFANGGFETGDTTGWTTGAGTWNGAWPINPDLYSPGGARYNMAYYRGDVVTPGNDPIVGPALNRVYSGSYAYRANDQYDNYDYSVGVIKQTVENYSGNHIYFAWAAVLQSSHNATDSDNFTIKLVDAAGAVLYQEAYSSFSAPGAFISTNTGWYYTPWQVQDITVTPGGTYTLMLLAADCAYGAHAGYVYLDGFGVAPPPQTTPEPTTMLLLGLGLIGLAGFRKRS